MPWLARPWWVLLAVLAVLLVYYPVVHYQYVWDDLAYFNAKSSYRDPAQFWPSLRHAFVMSDNYFRPLTVLTFLLEMRGRPHDPALSHAINLILHGVNVGLVGFLSFLVLRGRSDRGLWALAVALFYGLHPAMTEAVAFVSSRFDLMMTSFLLLALIADLGLRTRMWPRVLVVSLLFLCAALCKEMAVAFIPILPLWGLLTSGAFAASGTTPGTKRTARPMAMLGGVVLSGLLYLLIRWLSMGYVLRLQEAGTLNAGPLGNHLLLVLKSLGRYAGVALWPFTLVRPVHFTPLPVSLGDWQAWAAVAAGVAAILAWYLFRRRLGSLPFWFLLPLLATLPVVNLAPLSLSGNAFAADRYLTFPLALFAIALGVTLGKLGDAARGGGEGAVLWPAALMLGWAVVTVGVVRFSILPHWQNEMTFWTWAAAKAPGSSVPHSNLSAELSAMGEYQAALREAQLAVEADPVHADALSNMGVVLLRLNRVPEAIVYWERAVASRPGDAVLWTNLAAAYRLVGRFEDSIRALKEHALVIDPRDGYALMGAGLTYQASDRPDLAVPYFERSIPLLPPAEAEDVRQRLQTGSPVPHSNLSGELSARGDYQAALREAQLAVEADPRDADALSNMGVALYGLKRVPEAIVYWERAVASRPGDAVLWTNLAAAYRLVGRFEDSIRALKEHALVLDPRDAYALLNAGLTYQAWDRPNLAVPYFERSIPLLPPAEAEDVRQRLKTLSSPKGPSDGS